MRCWKILITALLPTLLTPGPVLALTVSAAKPARPTIEAAFPEATRIAPKAPAGSPQGPLVRAVYRADTLLGYAFETIDISPLPAYSGEPINLLVALNPDGRFRTVQVLEHHEPILLAGIAEQQLFDFTKQYADLSVASHIRIGAGRDSGSVELDAITGATVTVMVLNETLLRASARVARALGLDGFTDLARSPSAMLRTEVFGSADWMDLIADGSIRRLRLRHDQVDAAFAGTAAAPGAGALSEQRREPFIELFYTLLTVPSIGHNLLGETEYPWLMAQLEDGDHAIAVFGRGAYSFKGNAYVRGGIFDRIALRQDGQTISFRDSDYHRIKDVLIEGFPRFTEMMIFIIRAPYQFDPGRDWQLELLVRRQIGALDSELTSFFGDYRTPDVYLDRPAAPETPASTEPEPPWRAVWQDRRFQISVICLSLSLLTAIIFFQDVLVRYPRLLARLRQLFLVYTVVFLGWYALGQLSIVNVFTFVHAVLGEFRWQLFLLDPVIFILWAYVAVTLLLWGRGIYCGWLCPFGALQELVNKTARRLRIRQLEPPAAVHERLWAVKYIILLGLFAVSLESLGDAERYAEVEPFKTVILLKFQREWGYLLYAALLLLMAVFTRKLYCRYLCPLGAALVIPSKFRIFDWLKRRKECGQPCQVCANECEIQAIGADGRINANECHHCLDCQITYHQETKCPPLILRAKKRRRHGAVATTEQTTVLELHELA